MSEVRTVPASATSRRTSPAGAELAAVLAIAQRDVTKFLADRPRIVATFVLPFLLVVILGRSFQSGLGGALGFDYLTFVFTGVYAQTLFQSSALGLLSLLEDRENDFTQEPFVAPVSRYSIVLGKIVGESMVALVQAAGIVGFGLVVGVRFSLVVPDSGRRSRVPVRRRLRPADALRRSQPPGRRAAVQLRVPATVPAGGRLQPDPVAAAVPRRPVAPRPHAVRRRPDPLGLLRREPGSRQGRGRRLPRGCGHRRRALRRLPGGRNGTFRPQRAQPLTGRTNPVGCLRRPVGALAVVEETPQEIGVRRGASSTCRPVMVKCAAFSEEPSARESPLTGRRFGRVSEQQPSRRGGPGFPLALGAAAASAVMLGITLVGNVPLNNRTLAYPGEGDEAGWSAIRRPWERLHTARVLLDLTAFAALVTAALADEWTAGKPRP